MPHLEPVARPLVLVVDDSEDVLEATARYLRAKGFDVVTAESPFGVTNLVRRHAPAVIVLDVHIPALDGKAIAGILRGHPDTRHTPIVFYSASDQAEIEALAREIEGAVPLAKSAGLAALCEAMRRLLPTKP